MDSDAEGIPSEFFDYFKVLVTIHIYRLPLHLLALNLSIVLTSVIQVLCIQGFLTCRKHAERIILLVEMLQVCKC